MNSIEGINFVTFQRIDLMAVARIFRCQGYCWLFRFVFPALIGVPNLADVGVKHKHRRSGVTGTPTRVEKSRVCSVPSHICKSPCKLLCIYCFASFFLAAIASLMNCLNLRN